MKIFLWLFLCFCIESDVCGILIMDEVILNCEDTKHVAWENYGGILLTCSNSDLVIKNPETFIEMEEPDIITSGLSLKGQAIEYFPRGINEYFSELIAFALTDSEISYLQPEDLEQLGRNLKVLNLKNNKIQAIEKEVFVKTPNLQILTLDQNPIVYIERYFTNNLKHLERLSFRSVSCVKNYNSYKEIYTKNAERDYRDAYYSIAEFESNPLHQCNQISITEKRHKNNQEKLAHSLLSSTINLESFSRLMHDISSKQQKSITKTIGMNLTCELVLILNEKCNVRSFVISDEANDNIMIEEVMDETEQQPWSYRDFKGIIFKEFLMMFLPLNIGEKFSGLTELTVDSTGLVEIKKENFQNMENLKKLILINNIIFEVPLDVFDDLVSVEEINLGGNKIQTIDSESFKNLNTLKFLKLRGNMLKFISGDILEVADFVDMRNNRCINMKYPLVGKNKMENEIIDKCIAPVEMTCEIINSTCNAQDLKIKYPKTKLRIPIALNSSELGDSFTLQTKILKIQNQAIKFMPRMITTYFLNIEELIIDNSSLSAFNTGDFSEFDSTLKIIQITNNNITKIQPKVFDELKSLELLDLSKNEIVSLPNGVFAQLINLKILNLSNNLLSRFMPDYLPKKNVIEQFILKENEIEVFPAKSLRHLRKSKIIDLSGNICIDKKYDSSVDNYEKIMKLSGDVDFNCSDD